MSEYKSLLPEYNPDPVFIFLKNGDCYFKNRPATQIFKNLNHINDLSTTIDIKLLISNSLQRSITYQLHDRYYLIKLVGVQDKEILMAYSQEITELITSMQKEKESMQVKNDFFRNISHEMKTPLNAIMGFLPILKKSLKQDSKDLDIFRTIEESTKELHKLIDKTLDVQKIHNNSFEFTNTSFELLPLLEELLKTYRHIAQEKELKFRVLIEEKFIPPLLIGDEKRVLQVIESILSNAIKFTPKNGIVATKISYDTLNHLLKINIKDNGIGIAQEYKEKIFDAQQVDASTTRAFEGCGLELYIVHNIIKNLKGTIKLQSELGIGSEFIISLPISSKSF